MNWHTQAAAQWLGLSAIACTTIACDFPVAAVYLVGGYVLLIILDGLSHK